jgi:hypothetical protein
MRQAPPNLQMETLTRQVYRLLDGYARLGEDLWGRSWNIASGSLRRAVGQVERSALGLRGAEHLFRNLLDEYANYVAEMAMVLPLAAEAASARIDRAPRAVPNGGEMHREGAAPRAAGVMYEVPGTAGSAQPLALPLPARFIDASQGWAVYVVPAQIATEILGASTEMVTPFDLGGGRALLAVMGIDYRVCDLGRYQEIALALAVRSNSDPAEIPGAMFVGIGVNGEFSRDAGRAVWGLEKVLHTDLSVSYSPDRVRFGLGPRHPDALSIGFPRFGARRSDRIPILIYSRRDDPARQAATPLRSIMSLSGHGGGLQIGGSVSIHLGSANRSACVCRGSIEHCLCRTLETFDVKDRLPAANGWTEHLSGIFDAPEELSSAVT